MKCFYWHETDWMVPVFVKSKLKWLTNEEDLPLFIIRLLHTSSSDRPCIECDCSSSLCTVRSVATVSLPRPRRSPGRPAQSSVRCAVCHMCQLCQVCRYGRWCVQQISLLSQSSYLIMFLTKSLSFNLSSTEKWWECHHVSSHLINCFLGLKACFYTSLLVCVCVCVYVYYV